jgi:signal transduction histidine kinase/CheY-like chemotaxis protein
MAHGFCFSWEKDLVSIHVISDFFTGVAYYIIALTICYFLCKRKDFPLRFIIRLSSLFLLLCGTSHFFAILTIFYPFYWMEGYFKFLTMFVSLITAVIFIPKIPEAISMPNYAAALTEIQETEKELQETNNELRLEVATRVSTQQMLELQIKESENLQNKLSQSHKMEAIGRLAGGIAHDFNNKLTVITGYIDLIKMNKQITGIDLVRLDEIQLAARHSGEITRKLLTFARDGVISPKELDLDSILSETRKSLKRIIGEDIRIEYTPNDDLWTTLLDPTQVDQILMNLIVNARDAMPNGGVIKLETSNVYVDKHYSAESVSIPIGEYIQLVVSDNGQGMSKSVQDHIFEPFFTTKDVDKGTGLGLSTVYGIVSQNLGFINVYSEVGIGTSFKIHFPRHIKVGEEEIKTSEADLKIVFGKGNIMVVEDEEILRRLASEMLRHLGYSVIEAKSPLHAVDLFNSDAAEFVDLILTDIVMPEMTGKDMVDQILKIKPSIPIVFMSGYTNGIISSKGIMAESVDLLQKPFNLSKLSHIVEKALKK